MLETAEEENYVKAIVYVYDPGRFFSSSLLPNLGILEIEGRERTTG